MVDPVDGVSCLGVNAAEDAMSWWLPRQREGCHRQGASGLADILLHGDVRL